MFSLLLHELRTRRGTMLGWGLGLTVFFAVYMIFYPALPAELRDLDLQSIELYRAFGNMSMATFEGYIASTIYNFFGLLLGIFAIGAGTGALAGEEDAGTLELQLALPLPRWQLVLAKAAALALVALIILLAAGAAAAAIFLAIRDQIAAEVGPGGLFAATVAAWPLAFLFLMLGLWLGALLPSRRAALAAAILLLAAAFVGNNLGGIFPAMAWLQSLSPFHYQLATAEQLIAGPDPANLLALTAAGLALLGLALLSFQRRDVTVGAWPWAR